MLKIVNISKRYSKVTALGKTSISLSDGIYGLLGPNGAGKTTLMNIIATVISSDKGGDVFFCGKNIKDDLRYYRSRLGFAPQEIQLPGFFLVDEFMMYIASLKGLNNVSATLQKEQLLKSTNLFSRRFDRIKNLSGGMKQRLNVAQAFLGDPKIILLDEPTRGLDIEEQERILNFIAEQKNKIVVVSSHIAKDIQTVCSEVIVLNKGELLHSGGLGELVNKYKANLWDKVFLRDSSEFKGLNFEIISTHINGDSVKVKIFSETNPGEGWKNGDVSIEDIYLKMINDASE